MQRKYLWLLLALTLIFTSCDPYKSVNPTITPSLTPTSTFTDIPTTIPLVPVFPGVTIPEGLGVQVPYEMDKIEVDALSRAGFRIVREELTWSMVEQIKGVYWFQSFDKLVDNMTQHA